MPTLTRLRASLALLLAAVVVSASCAGTFGKKGKRGNVRFCGKRGFHKTKNPTKPLAPQSLITIRTCGGGHGDVASAKSTSSEIFAVTGVSGQTMTIQTYKEGKAKLKVEMQDGAKDALKLNVDQVGEVDIEVRKSSYYEAHVEPEPRAEIAALQNDEIPLAFTRYNNDDKLLHGGGDASWRLRGAEASTLTGEGGDFANVLRTGDRRESLTVEVRGGGALPVEVVRRSRIDRIELFVLRGNNVLLDDRDQIEFSPGESFKVEVVPLDERGRLVAGTEETELETRVFGGDDIFTSEHGTSFGGVHEFPLGENRKTSLTLVDENFGSAEVEFEWRGFDATIFIDTVE